MISVERGRAIVQRFAETRVLVIGDLMLDRYVWGSVDRISPEAPVPVVRVGRESSMLGGAGNVVRNLASLGSQVDFVALIGCDEAARELHRRLDHWKIDASGLIEDAERPTTQKTRVIAHNQQVVRYDHEVDEPLRPRILEQVLERVQERAAKADGVVLEDYGKGLLDPAVVPEVMRICAEHELPVFVDPKGLPWDMYAGAALVKPNLREAQDVTGIRVRNGADLERVGRSILEMSGAKLVAITRGEDGMALYSSDAAAKLVATRPRAVADQAGAGDTAISTLALARLSGATWEEAAALANAAAGIVIGIPGTATLSADELLQSLGAAF